MLTKKQKKGLWLLALISLEIAGVVPTLPALGAPIESFTPLYLEMDPTDAEVLFRKEPTDDSTFPLTLVEKDQRLQGRVEVVGKFTRHFLKKSLTIKLDKKGPKWQGRHNKISLRSMSTDLSKMREALGWNLFTSLGMAAPHVEHVRLYINNEFIGFYLFIEWITPKVIARFGFGDDGLFFHPNDSFYCGDMTLANQPRLEQCFLKLSPQDNDYTPLRNLIEEINKTPVDEFDVFLDKHFYADSIINWLILNTVAGNGDTYNKNYFLYFSKKTSQWMVIPWDFDLSFGRNSDSGLPFPRNVLNDNYQYFYPPELGASNPLKEKTLKNPRLLARFRTRLSHVLGIAPEMVSRPEARHADTPGGGFKWVRALFTRLWKGEGDEASRVAETPLGGFGWFHPDSFEARVTAFEQQIRKDLASEKYPGSKGYPFDQQVEALRMYNQWRYAVLKKMILEPTPFNTAHWHPYLYYPSFTPVDPTAPLRRQRVPLFLTATAEVAVGASPVVMMDEFMARPLGILDIQEVAQVRPPVETKPAPDPIPPDPPAVAPNPCIEPSLEQPAQAHPDVKTEPAPDSIPPDPPAVAPNPCIERSLDQPAQVHPDVKIEPVLDAIPSSAVLDPCIDRSLDQSAQVHPEVEPELAPDSILPGIDPNPCIGHNLDQSAQVHPDVKTGPDSIPPDVDRNAYVELSSNQPVRVRLEVETERAPDSLPPGVDRNACIERSWYFDIKTPGTALTANIQVDYLQESSLRNEIGPNVTDENKLVLWAFQDKTWRPLQTAVNPLANILRAEDVHLLAGDLLHLAACQK